MGCSKGHHSQCKNSHSVKQILDLAHVYSAVTFYLAYWHKGSLFRLFRHQVSFLPSSRSTAERWLLASLSQSDPWALVQLLAQRWLMVLSVYQQYSQLRQESKTSSVHIYAGYVALPR